MVDVPARGRPEANVLVVRIAGRTGPGGAGSAASTAATAWRPVRTAPSVIEPRSPVIDDA